MYFGTLAAGLQYVKANRIKPLAVTARKRSAILPEVPTIAESGYPDYEVTAWWLMMAPKGTQPSVVSVLNQEIVKHINLKGPQESLQRQGIDTVGSTPQQATAFLQGEIAKWRDVVSRGKIAMQ
jgi:tripartite-type tricarboxylate transporter receptor subunit TctC